MIFNPKLKFIQMKSYQNLNFVSFLPPNEMMDVKWAVSTHKNYSNFSDVEILQRVSPSVQIYKAGACF